MGIGGGVGCVGECVKTCFPGPPKRVFRVLSRYKNVPMKNKPSTDIFHRRHAIVCRRSSTNSFGVQVCDTAGREHNDPLEQRILWIRATAVMAYDCTSP